MATTTFVKFYQFVQDQAEGKHNFAAGGASYKFMLTNTAPALTNKVYGDVSANEIAASTNGYTAGGYASALFDTNSSGVLTVNHPSLTISPTGSASIGPFRYLILYNVNGQLVGYYDVGASTTLNAATSDSYTLSDSSGFLVEQ